MNSGLRAMTDSLFCAQHLFYAGLACAAVRYLLALFLLFGAGRR